MKNIQSLKIGNVFIDQSQVSKNNTLIDTTNIDQIQINQLSINAGFLEDKNRLDNALLQTKNEIGIEQSENTLIQINGNKIELTSLIINTQFNCGIISIFSQILLKINLIQVNIQNLKIKQKCSCQLQAGSLSEFFTDQITINILEDAQQHLNFLNLNFFALKLLKVGIFELNQKYSTDCFIDINFANSLEQIIVNEDSQSLQIDKIIQNNTDGQLSGEYSVKISQIKNVEINEIIYGSTFFLFWNFQIISCENVLISSLKVAQKYEEFSLFNGRSVFSQIQNLIIDTVSICAIKNPFPFSILQIDNSSTQIKNVQIDSFSKISFPLFQFTNSPNSSINNLMINQSLILNQIIIFQNVSSIQISNFNLETLVKQGQNKYFDNYSKPAYLFQIGESDLVEISNCKINFNNNYYGLLFAQNITKINIIETKLENAFAINQGGCIYLSNSQDYKQQEPQISIINSTFYNFSSTYFGGCIYGGKISQIENVEFSSCSSYIGGAMYISNKSALNELNKISFKQNKADLYGNNYSFKIQEIIAEKIYEFNPQFQSNDMYLFELKDNIKLVRGIDYVIGLQFKINDEIYPQKNQKVESLNMYYFLKEYQNFQVDTTLNISSPFLSFYLDAQQSFEINNVQLQISDQSYRLMQLFYSDILKNCPKDMQTVQVNQKQNLFLCKYCDFQYALQIQQQEDRKINQCSQCNALYFSLCYANYSQIREGYWRESYSLDNKEIISCQIAPQSCIGGSDLGNQLCYEGHLGPQCLNCDIKGEYWKTQYSMYGNFSCTKCNSIKQNTLKICFILLLLLLSIGIIIISSFKSLKNHILAQYLSKMNLFYIGKSLQFQNLASTYVKLLLFNFSIYQNSNGFTNVDVFNSIKNASIAFSDPLNSQIISIDCLLIYINPNLSSIGFANAVLYTILPCLFFLFALIIILIIMLLKKSLNNKRQLYRIFISFQYIFIIIFNSIFIRISLESFSCLNLYQDQYYSLIDLSLECNQSSQLTDIHSITIPIFIIFVILIPIIMFALIFQNRKRLSKIKVTLSFGFFYKEYKNKHYYWEFVRLIIRLALISFSIGFKQYPFISGILQTLSLFIYYTAIQKLNPFSLRLINKLEKISISLSILILQTSLLFLQFSSNENANILLLVKVVYIISQVLSLLFVLFLLILIVISFLQKQIIKLYLNFKWRYLQYFIPNSLLKIQKVNKNYKKLKRCVKLIIQNQIYTADSSQQPLLDMY